MSDCSDFEPSTHTKAEKKVSGFKADTLRAAREVSWGWEACSTHSSLFSVHTKVREKKHHQGTGHQDSTYLENSVCDSVPRDVLSQ